jgi:hypothetical protein
MAKKPIFLFAVLAAVSLTFAQEQKAISFGVRAGLNLGKIEQGRNYSRSDEDGTRERTTDMTYSTGNLIGYHIGAVVDIGINEFFYIQPGILLISKGGETNSEYKSRSDTRYEIEESKTIIAPYYVDIPIMLSLKGKLNDNLALRAQAGPYIGFGLFGKMESEYKEYDGNNNRSEKSEIKDIFSPSAVEKKEGDFEGLNRFNAGIGFGCGIEFNSFYLGLSYNYGLTNSYKDENSNQLYERTLGITLGYNF